MFRTLWRARLSARASLPFICRLASTGAGYHRTSFKGLLPFLGSGKPPVPDIRPDSSSTDKLKELSKIPLWNVYKQLRNDTFAEPYVKLNGLWAKDKDSIFNLFTTSLYSSFEDPRPSGEPPIALVDFVNPRITRIPKLMLYIDNNDVPAYISSHFNVQTKAELLTKIFSSILYKSYLEFLLNNAATALTNQRTEDISMVDLSNPSEWFPAARKMKRKIIMHVGPTNSGKTHHALQRLKESKSGYYAGPLRLLAREVYERFNHEGIRCNLVTGEEIIPSIDEFGKISELSSGTIEMVPLNRKMDTCIIDEIQMIGDGGRGDAWTNALLGVQAKEVYLCGEESAVPLVKKLAQTTGDELVIHKYKRLGKLTVEPNPVNSYGNLRKGDCVIAFSKSRIIEIKCRIEKQTRLRVGVVYGALPPEIRSKEANHFNSGEYDILVASDAIGMGLNLKIKRIVFSQVLKFDGNKMKKLTISALKQIAGRAGRYSLDKGQLEGFVAAMKKTDLKFIENTMAKDTPDLTKACLWPTPSMWMQYISKFPSGTSFYDVLSEFESTVSKNNYDNYFILELKSKFSILRLFLRDDLYRHTTVHDQLSLSVAPINVDLASSAVFDVCHQFFQAISNCHTKNVFDFGFLHLDILKSKPVFTSQDNIVLVLQALEENHKIVLLFLWLSQRWPTLFVDKESAVDIKTLIEKRINEELNSLRRVTKDSKALGFTPMKIRPETPYLR